MIQYENHSFLACQYLPVTLLDRNLALIIFISPKWQVDSASFL